MIGNENAKKVNSAPQKGFRGEGVLLTSDTLVTRLEGSGWMSCSERSFLWPLDGMTLPRFFPFIAWLRISLCVRRLRRVSLSTKRNSMMPTTRCAVDMYVEGTIDSLRGLCRLLPFGPMSLGPRPCHSLRNLPRAGCLDWKEGQRPDAQIRVGSFASLPSSVPVTYYKSKINDCSRRHRAARTAPLAAGRRRRLTERMRRPREANKQPHVLRLCPVCCVMMYLLPG